MSKPVTRIMFDTNVLVSAILNARGAPSRALLKAAESSCVLVLCDQILDELRRIYNSKFPLRIPDMERFLSIAQYDLVVLTAEDVIATDEEAIRDIDDRSILRAARKVGVDILVTGDKDFLDSPIKNPRIMTVADYLEMC